MTHAIKRAYVRRYSDNGQITAYVEWSNGARTEATLRRVEGRKGRPADFTFGEHMHALFGNAKRSGLKLQRENW